MKDEQEIRDKLREKEQELQETPQMFGDGVLWHSVQGYAAALRWVLNENKRDILLVK